MYTTKNLQEDMKSLDFKGFKFNKEIMGFSWIQDEGTKINKIIIGYRGYPEGFYSYTPSVSIAFSKVETLLNNLVEKFEINQGYGNDTIQAKLYPLEGVDYTVFETKIHDEGSFQIVAEEIKKIISYGAMPFFEKYKTIEAVFETTEQMGIKEMSTFISQPLPQRRMIIKKLCKDSNYNSYVNWLIDYYKLEKEPDLPIIEKLNEYLEELY